MNTMNLTHPVISDNIQLPTPSIRSAYEFIADVTLQRTPGICFRGAPRTGKSSAIDVIQEQIHQSFPEIPTYHINAKWHPGFSESRFFGELLKSIARVMSPSGKIEIRQNKVEKFLWTEAQSRHSDRIIFFIDEAQCWLEPQLTMLRDLSNELKLHYDIRLLFVSFGTEELTAIHSGLLHEGRGDLIGRFMPRIIDFLGVCNAQQLSTTMGLYDDAEVSEYPPGSGLSYSESLLPIAFRSGWRLQCEAPRLWEQFRKAAQSKGGIKDVGMQWVNASIRDFFGQHMALDHAGLKGCPEEWAAAVERSGYENSLKHA